MNKSDTPINKREMVIQEVAVDAVTPYEKNPRKIPKEAVDRVAASIKEFGFKQPIVVDKDMVIIVGHTRLMAAKMLGYEKVPVLVASDLSPEKARAYRLADNKTNELTDWDFDTLQDDGVRPDILSGDHKPLGSAHRQKGGKDLLEYKCRSL